MRIDVAVLALAAAACGGAQRPDGGISDCAGYATALRPALARLSRAADRFADRPPGAPAGRELAASLEKQRVELAAFQIRDAEIRRAHAGLTSALDEMSRALTTLADVLDRRDESRRDEARSRLKTANDRWATAVAGVRGVCPAAGE
jgi:hypothetical protein